jgi:hypothetical protein
MAQPTSWLSKALAAVVFVLIIAVAFVFQKATNKTDTENYTKGAVHTENNLTIAPVENNYPLALPRCGRLFSVDPSWAKQFEKKESTKGKGDK